MTDERENKMAHYLVQYKFVGGCDNPELKGFYWKFDRHSDMVNALNLIQSISKIKKDKIPANETINEFSHFEDIGYRGLFVRMVAKKV